MYGVIMIAVAYVARKVDKLRLKDSDQFMQRNAKIKIIYIFFFSYNELLQELRKITHIIIIKLKEVKPSTEERAP